MTKNGTQHVIPLSRQAIDLLQSLRPLDEDPAAFVFASRAGKALDDWEGATQRIQAASGTTDWHRHDLRRTAATTMGMLGTIPDVVEAVPGLVWSQHRLGIDVEPEHVANRVGIFGAIQPADKLPEGEKLENWWVLVDNLQRARLNYPIDPQKPGVPASAPAAKAGP